MNRFKLKEYVNPRTGSHSWRVEGITRDGRRIRQNFTDAKAAQCQQVELETEYLARHSETTIRATKLTETQLRLAETALLKLGNDLELLPAVDYWIAKGRQQAVQSSVRLDEATSQFKGRNHVPFTDPLFRELCKMVMDPIEATVTKLLKGHLDHWA